MLLCSCMHVQAYELLQGNLVRFSPDANTKDVPTAVLVHGILGSKRNLNTFARMIAEVRVCMKWSCCDDCSWGAACMAAVTQGSWCTSSSGISS